MIKTSELKLKYNIEDLMLKNKNKSKAQQRKELAKILNKSHDSMRKICRSKFGAKHHDRFWILKESEIMLTAIYFNVKIDDIYSTSYKNYLAPKNKEVESVQSCSD